MNLEKASKEIELLVKKKKLRQNLLFDEDLYKRFVKEVGKSNVSKALSILMRNYLEFRSKK